MRPLSFVSCLVAVGSWLAVFPALAEEPNGAPRAAEEAGVAPPASEEPPAPQPIEVTVAGTRPSRTPGSALVVTRRQLERWEYDDPQAVLRQVPGITVRQEDGVGLRPNIGIRGVNPDRSKKVTLMEDGILFGPAPYSAPAAYYFPLVTRMTAVRVVKGPSAVAFGPHTVGGAVDFSSRPIPDETAGALDFAFGEYGYRKIHAHAGSNGERLGFLLEGVQVHDTGFKRLPSGADTGSTRNEVMSKLSFVFDPSARDRQELGVKVSYSDEVSNETYLGLTDQDFRSDPDRRYPSSALDQMRNHRISVVASHVFQTPIRGLKMKTDVYRHDYDRIWRKLNRLEGAEIAGVLGDPEDPLNASYLAVLRGESDTVARGETLLVGPNDRRFVSEGVQEIVTFGVDHEPVRQRFELGVRLHHDEAERHHSESPFSMVGGELVPQDAPVRVTAANRASSDALALHAMDAATLGALTVTAGARAEIIRMTLENRVTGAANSALVRAFMPGIGAYYGITEALGVLAGVHRGFSPPPPPEDLAVAQKGPQPEYSVNYEAGGRLHDGLLRAEVIGFYNDYSNLTDICSLASGCLESDLDRAYSAGRAHVYGLEVFGTHDVPLTGAFKLPVMLAYTFTRARFESSFRSQDPIYGVVQKDDEMPYVPRHQLSAAVGVEHARAGGSLSVSYLSAMREEAGSEPLSQTLSTDTGLVVDVVGSVKLTRSLSLYGTLRNVFDERYIVSHRPYGARPNPPRWLQAGAKLAF
jgi:Fe(3+) dicitrate transport protein